MAPSAGHLHKLVVRNYRLFKYAWKAATQGLSARLDRTLARLEPVRIPVHVSHQPTSALAAIRQRQSRFYSTVTGSGSGARAARADKSTWPQSRTRSAVEKLTGRSPFASSLRPNLTGGAMPRTAGGYGLGSGRAGGARYFSHTPAAPAQVVQNVSQAVRAFLLSGQRAQYDGVDGRGNKQYRAVTVSQDTVSKKMARIPQSTPGSFIDFSINPTITALTPLSSLAAFAGFPTEGEDDFKLDTLNTSGLLDVLSTDFSRVLGELAMVLADLKKLATLGDLPITYRTGSKAALRIHFPGCDAGTVEKLCLELGVGRGTVQQDEEFDAYAGTEIALLFPFAPSEAQSEADSPNSELGFFEYLAKMDPLDTRDQRMFLDDEASEGAYSTESVSGHEAYEIVEGSSELSEVSPPWSGSRQTGSAKMASHKAESLASADSPLEYQDFDSIRQFIALCDGARR